MGWIRRHRVGVCLTLVALGVAVAIVWYDRYIYSRMAVNITNTGTSGIADVALVTPNSRRDFGELKSGSSIQASFSREEFLVLQLLRGNNEGNLAIINVCFVNPFPFTECEPAIQIKLDGSSTYLQAKLRPTLLDRIRGCVGF